jgi:hypothetical protein
MAKIAKGRRALNERGQLKSRLADVERRLAAVEAAIAPPVPEAAPAKATGRKRVTDAGE